MPGASRQREKAVCDDGKIPLEEFVECLKKS